MNAKDMIVKLPVEVWVHPDDLGRRDGLEGLELAEYVIEYLNDACSWGFRLDNERR